MSVIPNPQAATYSKTSAGLSDVTCVDNVYKFMGCSVVSTNVSVGFNSTPSSMNVTLVQDLDNGDSFATPVIPSVMAFSLPSGGIGAPIFVPNGTSLSPNGFVPTNIYFYFCGIITGYSKSEIDIGGNTYTVNLVDPREVLSGVQCLLSGFALSQSLGTGSPRFTGVENVIDVFGYYNYGLDSNKNAYGIEWSKIKTAIEAAKVTINGIKMEFYFTGSAFTSAPSWYRLDETSIDLLGLCQKVCGDAGADFIAVARKVASDTMVVELRGVSRNNGDPLTQSDLDNFLTNRADIVESCKLGKEYRNEPTSSIVVGGMKNSNYVARPTEYLPNIHLTSGKEDYNKFPSSIKARLFGGSTIQYDADSAGNPATSGLLSLAPHIGAIFPFWGYASTSGNDPMAEPFLPLDHLVFDRDSDSYLNIMKNIPLCKVSLTDLQVRTVVHDDVFLSGDGDSDYRPFGYLEEYKFQDTNQAGYVRGLPLNTEVLRAALASEEAFYSIYSIYYPDIADRLYFPRPNWTYLKEHVDKIRSTSSSTKIDLHKWDVRTWIRDDSYLQAQVSGLVANKPQGRLSKLDAQQQLNPLLIDGIYAYRQVIYEQVRQYANDNMGKRFIVVLPRSPIMTRIFAGQPVPTNVNKPEIEYIVDDRGYWENIPSEFDGVANTGSGALSSDQELQIRRRFMVEDGRFLPMVAVDWKPSGNASFNSNALNRVMFQDLPVSEFRPNRIADGNPNYVFMSCNVAQLVKRPDLALVELPAVLSFDPLDGNYNLASYTVPTNKIEKEISVNHAGIVRYLWYFVKRNDNLRDAIKNAAASNSISFDEEANKCVNAWAHQIMAFCTSSFRYFMLSERVMDLKAVIVPLTSTWVSYGPWYYTSADAQGMVKIDVDQSLVPWNFARSSPWYANLDQAGNEKLQRSLAVTDYVDSASITVAGFPELGLGTNFGYNSNITTISVDFGVGGVKTTYNLSTYNYRPGTYRKSDYDNIAKARVDTRPRIVDPVNTNLIHDFGVAGTNRFAD